jgi:peroxiredoxin
VKRQQVWIWVGLSLWLGAVLLPAWGADQDYFQALQIVRFPDAVVLPPIILPDVDGKPVTLQAFQGKVVLLNFWTTWCPYCQRERKALEALHQRYKDQGLAIVAIAMGESADKVKAFQTKHQLNFVHLLDADKNTAMQFAVRATPTNFLLDRRGRVLGGGMGYRDWAAAEAHQLIQSLLQESAH